MWKVNKAQKFYRINNFIQAANLRVLDEKGKQIGILPKFDALRQAQTLGLDLVEITSNAVPAVAKIIDFKKFKYLESKRQQQIKKKNKEVRLKEIRLTPFIGEHDLSTRTNQAKEFLEKGNRIKVNIRFRGRELSRKNFGYELATRFTQSLAEKSQPTGAPKWEGRNLVFFLEPRRVTYAKDKNEKSRQQEV